MREERSPRLLRRALVGGALAAASLLTACAGHDEALQAKVGELEQRIKDMEREGGRQVVRFEDVNDRLNLLTDRVETNRLALERRGVASPLPVVVATPQGYPSGAWSPPPYSPPAQPAASPRDSGYKRLEFQESRQDSRELARIAVPDSGSRPPAPQLAPQPAPVDDGPYEDVVISEEEYQRFVQEDGLPNRGGGLTKTSRDSSAASPSSYEADSSGGGGSASSRAGRRSAQPDVVLDERLPVPDGAGTPAPAASSALDSSASPMELYKNALADYRAGRYAEALTTFKRYLDKGPEPDYLDNAYYWIGECSYGLGQFPQAITWFDRVIKETPGGNKVPDSMLKASLAYIQIGKPSDAKGILLNLVQTYPSTNAAKLATDRLKELE